MSKNKLHLSDSSDVVQDLELNVLRKRVAELEKHNVALGETIDRFTKALSEKDEEILHLQRMLGGTVPVLSGTNVNSPLTDEEVIAELQLQRLKTKAQHSELTLEETKKFDLLVKNKRLAQGNATSSFIDVQGQSITNNKKKLIAIASQVIESDKIGQDSDGE